MAHRFRRMLLEQLDFMRSRNICRKTTSRMLQAQCRQMGSRCAFVGYGFGKALNVKQESDFCLEAAGDTPYRKSLADSIGMGCIPMLFHPMTDNANEVLWHDWKESARVLVPCRPR